MLRPALRAVPRTVRTYVRPATVMGTLFRAPRIRTSVPGASRFYSEGGLPSADAELLGALRSELKIESESLENEAEDHQRFQEYLEKHGFQLVAEPGHEEVQLVRNSGSETVRIFFNISDVINSDSLLDDAEFEDAAEDEDAAAAREDDFKSDVELPIRLNIVVEKPSGGALGIEAVAQDDMILVESIIPYASKELATDESAEADYKRRQAYQGPPFSVLDPSVQNAVQQFLESRSIDSGLALFIAEFSSFRENKEYISWMGKIANILEHN